MNYLIVNNGTIKNIIISDESYAQSIGAKPYYNGAAIGESYNPPTLDDLQQQIDTQKIQNGILAETICNMIYENDKKELGVKE